VASGCRRSATTQGHGGRGPQKTGHASCQTSRRLLPVIIMMTSRRLLPVIIMMTGNKRRDVWPGGRATPRRRSVPAHTERCAQSPRQRHSAARMRFSTKCVALSTEKKEKKTTRVIQLNPADGHGHDWMTSSARRRPPARCCDDGDMAAAATHATLTTGGEGRFWRSGGGVGAESPDAQCEETRRGLGSPPAPWVYRLRRGH